MVGGSSASQPAPPCSPDEWPRRLFLLRRARLILGLCTGHAHPLSCEHGAHVPALVFCMLARLAGASLAKGIHPNGRCDASRVLWIILGHSLFPEAV